MRLAFSFVFALSLGSHTARANESADIDKGIQQAQEELRNPKAVQAATINSKPAQQAVKNVQDISRSEENEKAIFDLAAEVMGNMKGQSLEDIIKIIEQAAKNPAAFADSWSPEQKNKLKELSARLPASKKSKP